MARKQIGAIITLKDNMTATLRGIRKEQSSFRKDVQETRKALEKAYKKKQDLRVNNSSAMKAIKETRKALEPFRRTMVLNMAYRDMISAKLRKTRNELMNIGRIAISPIVRVRDFATGVIGRIRAGLSSIALPVGIATAAGTAAVGASVASGAMLEQQQVAMRHFIGVNNQGMPEPKINQIADNYLKQLRDNANLTPFITSDVIAAGTRAINIMNGNTKDAMELVQVAEDMAALNPGKTLEQAMEALADLKTGETERMKEFGFKIRAADIVKAAGGKGDKLSDLTNEQIEAAYAKIIKTQIAPQFTGGSKKLSLTGAGLWSTIKGKLGTIAQDFGFNLLEKLKPAMASIIALIDRWSPKITEKLNKAVDSGFSYLKSRYIDNPEFRNLSFSGKVKFVFDDITSGIKEWLKGGGQHALNSLGKTIGDYLASGLELAAPRIAQAGLKIGSNIGSGILDGLRKKPLAYALIAAYFGFRVAGLWGGVGMGVFAIADSLPKLKPREKLKSISNGPVDTRGVFGLKNYNPKTDSKPRLNKVPKNAFGTNFWRGGLTWVGEKGPELVNLPRGSQVIPNNKIQNYANKSGNNITININGYNKSTREIMNELIPQLKLALANM